MPTAPSPAPQDPLHRVERIARVLDEAIRIPGTSITVGLDAVIGLIPGVGDVAGVALGSWFIYEAHRLGAPAALKWKMARNVGIDAISGLVPVLGDVVDVAYRSNRRNLQLLRGHFRPDLPVTPTTRSWVRLLVIAGLVAALYWGYWLFKA
ncbi:MAG: DUF4112 domain-containing protein [Pseudomonadota bacterium]